MEYFLEMIITHQSSISEGMLFLKFIILIPPILPPISPLPYINPLFYYKYRSYENCDKPQNFTKIHKFIYPPTHIS